MMPCRDIQNRKQKKDMAILDHKHQEILEEIQTHHLDAERRFHIPGCPWGCEDGFHEIALHEYGPLDAIAENDPAVIVLPHMILFACECSSAGGGVRRWPGWAAAYQ